MLELGSGVGTHLYKRVLQVCVGRKLTKVERLWESVVSEIGGVRQTERGRGSASTVGPRGRREGGRIQRRESNTSEKEIFITGRTHFNFCV